MFDGTFLASLLNFNFTSMMGIFLYWVPAGLCAFGYTVRTANNYMADKETREVGDYYSPSLTIGVIIGRGLATTIPVVNLWAALFDVAPKVFSRFFTLIGDLFDMPLVPDTAAAKAARTERNNIARNKAAAR